MVMSSLRTFCLVRAVPWKRRDFFLLTLDWVIQNQIALLSYSYVVYNIYVASFNLQLRNGKELVMGTLNTTRDLTYLGLDGNNFLIHFILRIVCS
jgi:hypothetical protein